VAAGELASAVKELGEVKYIVAPNSFHHLFIDPWVKHFPKAALLVVPQLVNKRPDLIPSMVMDESFQVPWGEDLHALFFPGSKLYSETAFYHISSKTLILTDLCFNLHQEQGVLATLMMKIYGVYKKFGPSKAVALFMGDKGRLKQLVDQLAQWDFNRVIVAHGQILENTSPAELRKSFDSIL
jgi:Domain of unknown function (DUF4336)